MLEHLLNKYEKVLAETKERIRAYQNGSTVNERYASMLDERVYLLHRFLGDLRYLQYEMSFGKDGTGREES